MRYSVLKSLVCTTILLFISCIFATAQDTERPLAPVLTLISVDPLSGFTHLLWSPGGSPDVAGYVIYLYIDGEGEATDTIFNPFATDYIHTRTYANNYSIEYVIAAIDSSDNTSPLSNALNTIYLTGSLDTCSHEIELIWRGYNDFPNEVNGYTLFASVDAAPPYTVGNTLKGDTSLRFSEFETNKTYCFTVEADVDGGLISKSNSFCIETDILRPPDWINGDYANVDSDNMIELSFTYDANSEIDHFRIEVSENPSGPFNTIQDIYNSGGQITVNDIPSSGISQYFRALAINNCNQPAISSNTVSAIIIESSIVSDEIELKWTGYREYMGDLSEYIVYRIENGQPVSIGYTASDDTLLRDKLTNFIYYIENDYICYQVIAIETGNPYIGSSSSASAISCVDIPVKIYSPNAFTPDGDLLNEYFAPVLTFTPTKYRLTITTKSGMTLFETDEYSEKWDGTVGGKPLQPDVYLWFLEVITPGGKEITRNGTITILFN